jgi:hypothetical protein
MCGLDGDTGIAGRARRDACGELDYSPDDDATEEEQGNV